LNFFPHANLPEVTVVIVGAIAAIALASLLVINGAFMLASPRAWFELPDWLAATRGPLTREKYSSGWGAVQVRLTGAAFLGTVVWVIYDKFLSH
jgi:hypothetical protein